MILKCAYYFVTGLMSLIFAATVFMAMPVPSPMMEFLLTFLFPMALLGTLRDKDALEDLRIVIDFYKVAELAFLGWPGHSVKLWAYNAYAFLMVGTLYSHLALQEVMKTCGTLVGLTLTVASHALWIQIRRQDALPDEPSPV